MWKSYYITWYRKRDDNFSRHLLWSTKKEDILQQIFQQAAGHSGQEREEKIFTGKDKSVVKTVSIQISEILLPENIQTTQHMTFFEQQ